MTETETSDKKFTDDNDKLWANALRIVGFAGPYASAFTSCIRHLVRNAIENQISGAPSKSVNTSSRFLMGRFLKAPAVLAPLHYATLTFHEERIKNKQIITPDHLIACYPPKCLAALLFVIYLTGHLRRRILKKGVEPDEWERIAKSLQAYADLGMHFGYAIPEITPERGLLLGATRQLAFALLLFCAPNDFKAYRRNLKQKKLGYCHQDEKKAFGTTSDHISFLLIQDLGLGSEIAESVFGTKEVGLLSKKLKPEMVMLSEWLDALVLTNEPPQKSSGDDYSVSDEVFEKLDLAIKEYQAQGSKHEWLNKRSADITETDFPQFFERGGALSKVKAPQGAFAEDNIEQSINYAELSEELKRLFPKEEFEQIADEIRHLLKS